MADNVAITAGSGTLIAADDISSVWYQRVKIAVGPDGTHTADLAGRAIGTDGVINVDPRPKRSVLSATSSGLTTAATAYSIGDQVGVQLSLSNAVRVSGGTGLITGIALLDEGDVTTAMDLVFFRDSVTLASDNVAYSVSDTDMRKAVAYVSLPGMTDLGANRFTSLATQVPFDCTATTLYVAMITRTANAVFAATSDLVLTVYVVQD